jgi:sarcosine oxidase
VLTVMEAGDVPANLGLLEAAGLAGRATPASAEGDGPASPAARALPPAELAVRYPQFLWPNGVAAILEPYAGAVLAGQALAAMAGWLAGQPTATLHPGRRVAAIDRGGAVRLADGGVLPGDRVVVAAGPWSRELLPASAAGDVTLYRQTMLSYAPPAGPAWAATPAVLGLGSDHGAWMMPPVAGTPARLSAASACRVVAEMTDRDAPDEWREHLTGRFAGLLAGFDPAAVIGAADGYYLASAANGGPLLAGLADGAVWMYAACGGMSFKFAPLIAGVLADRALGRPPRPSGLDSIDRPRQLAAAEGSELSGAGRHPTRNLSGAGRHPTRDLSGAGGHPTRDLSGAGGHPTRDGGPGRREETP